MVDRVVISSSGKGLASCASARYLRRLHCAVARTLFAARCTFFRPPFPPYFLSGFSVSVYPCEFLRAIVNGSFGSVGNVPA